MKLKQYSFIILLAIISFSLMSNKGGRGFLFGVGLTNSPGETGATCGQAGCHNGGNFGTGMDVFLSDAAGNILNEYEPGVSYNLHLNITNSIGNPQRYGFQMVALDDASNPVNNWGDVAIPYRKYAIGNRNYIEQTNALLDSNIVLPWTAPTEGSGSVNFYATVNNCNGNGNTVGDQAFSNVIAITEGGISSSSDLQKDLFSFYPNPVSDRIQIRTEKSNLIYTVYDKSGAIMKHLSTSTDQINVSQLLPGMYFLLANDQEGHVVHSERFIKI